MERARRVGSRGDLLSVKSQAKTKGLSTNLPPWGGDGSSPSFPEPGRAALRRGLSENPADARQRVPTRFRVPMRAFFGVRALHEPPLVDDVTRRTWTPWLTHKCIRLFCLGGRVIRCIQDNEPGYDGEFHFPGLTPMEVDGDQAGGRPRSNLELRKAGISQREIAAAVRVHLTHIPQIRFFLSS
jgi:hypothetical protein